MARIPLITKKEELPTQYRQVYDDIAKSRGHVGGPFQVLLHSPELGGRVAHLGAYVRFEGSLDPVLSELAVLTGAREFDCQYEWTAHEPVARRAGVREGAIVAIRDRKAPKGLTPEEKVVVQYVLELLRKHRVSEPTFQAALARFGVPGLVELTCTVGYYGMLAASLNAFEVEPAPGVTPLLPV